MKKINVFTAISILGLGSALLFTACGTTSKIPENEETPIETHEEELVEESAPAEIEEEVAEEAIEEEMPLISTKSSAVPVLIFAFVNSVV